MKKLKAIFNNSVDKIIAKESNEEKVYLALTMATGIFAALSAVALHHTVFFLRDLFKTNQVFEIESFIYGGIAIFISGWLTTRKFPFTAGSGVPNVKIALAVYNGKIRLGSTIAKFITTVLALGSGSHWPRSYVLTALLQINRP